MDHDVSRIDIKHDLDMNLHEVPLAKSHKSCGQRKGNSIIMQETDMTLHQVKDGAKIYFSY